MDGRVTPLTSRNVPYYKQIYTLFLRWIDEGQLPAGTQLPNEHALAKRFGVSRVPVRQALSILAEKNLIERTPGRGTFVAEPLHSNKSPKLTGFIEDYMTRGLRGKLTVLSSTDVRAPNSVAAYFGLKENMELFQIQRLRDIGGVPFSYVVNYLPEAVSKRIDQSDLHRLPMITILQERLGIALGNIRQEIQARIADSEISAHLGVEAGSAVMYVETFLEDASGAPLEYSQTFYNGEGYKYSVMLLSSRHGGGPSQPQAVVEAF